MGIGQKPRRSSMCAQTDKFRPQTQGRGSEGGAWCTSDVCPSFRIITTTASIPLLFGGCLLTDNHFRGVALFSKESLECLTTWTGGCQAWIPPVWAVGGWTSGVLCDILPWNWRTPLLE